MKRQRLVEYMKRTFRSKAVIKGKEGYYILVKGSIRRHSDFKCYVSSDRPSEYYMKQKLTELKGEINSCTVIVRDFSTPLSIVDRKTG